MEEDKYSLEAINELIAWFAAQKDLPESLDMDASIHIPNLKETIDGFTQMSLANYENPLFRPVIKRFYKLKEILENMRESQD